MNIDELTVGQLKEIGAMASALVCHPKIEGTLEVINIAQPILGEYCIARCYSAGVHAGTVVAVDGENVVLENSRRLWRWQAKDGVALSGVAQHGVDKNECKIDVINPVIYLSGVCELIPCTGTAKESIDEA